MIPKVRVIGLAPGFPAKMLPSETFNWQSETIDGAKIAVPGFVTVDTFSFVQMKTII
jgi:hypothetical protein